MLVIGLKIQETFVCFKSIPFRRLKFIAVNHYFLFQVHFNFRLAYRRSSHFCDQNTINQGSLLSAGSWSASCTNASNPNCASSITVGSANYRCTDYSTSEDWTMGENNFTYAFPTGGEVWTVRYVVLCQNGLNHSFFFGYKQMNKL